MSRPHPYIVLSSSAFIPVLSSRGTSQTVSRHFCICRLSWHVTFITIAVLLRPYFPCSSASASFFFLFFFFFHHSRSSSSDFLPFAFLSPLSFISVPLCFLLLLFRFHVYMLLSRHLYFVFYLRLIILLCLTTFIHLLMFLFLASPLFLFSLRLSHYALCDRSGSDWSR